MVLGMNHKCLLCLQCVTPCLHSELCITIFYKEAIQTDCYRLDFTCRSWNKGAIAFYEKFFSENRTQHGGQQLYRIHKKDSDRVVKLQYNL